MTSNSQPVNLTDSIADGPTILAIRPFESEDFPLFMRLHQDWVAECKHARQHGHKEPEITLQCATEVIYQFTRPLSTVRLQLAQGREAFAGAARAEIVKARLTQSEFLRLFELIVQQVPLNFTHN